MHKTIAGDKKLAAQFLRQVCRCAKVFNIQWLHQSVLLCIGTGINLVHTSIEYRQHGRGPVHPVYPLRKGLQTGDRKHREIPRKGQCLHGSSGNTHSGTRAGTTAVGEHVESPQRDAPFSQHLLDHGQQQFGLQPRGMAETRQHTAVNIKSDRTSLGRRFKR